MPRAKIGPFYAKKGDFIRFLNINVCKGLHFLEKTINLKSKRENMKLGGSYVVV